MPIPKLSLPIVEVLPQVLEALEAHPNLVVQAPPGAGKSTVLPLALLDAPWLQGQRILMLEPRRLAAKSVAARMASLLGEAVGETVGYAVRFERKASAKTRIEVVTEALLTRRLQQDSTLEGVGAVIFDEFHERSLHADLGLALCREVQQVLRDDLRLVAMSATINAQEIADVLQAPVVRSEGRQFPIEYRYEPPAADQPLAVQVAKATAQAFRGTPQGDLLVFLPGEGDILRTAELLADLPARVCPLYGRLPFSEQQEALRPDPQGRRKIVLATSIAETSLTIEGVRVVVDSGWARRPRFSPQTGFTRLHTERVTRATADQRAGRAGRLGPGHCVRLWSVTTQQHLEAQQAPEIAEADLAPLALELASWGRVSPEGMAWLTPPPEQALRQAQQLLQALEAVDAQGQITPRGRRMLALPAHPRLAHLLLEAQEWGLGALAADLAACLEEALPPLEQAGADLSRYVEALRRMRAQQRLHGKWKQVGQAAQQWAQLLGVRLSDASPDPWQLGKLVLLAYPERLAKRLAPQGNRYQLASGQIVRVPEHDALSEAPWLAVAHLDAGSGDGKAYLAVPVAPEDFAHREQRRRRAVWDPEQGGFKAYEEAYVGALSVWQKPVAQVSEEERVEVVGKALQENPQWLDWGEEARQWQARVMCLRQWHPDGGWPDVSDEALMARAEEWLWPFLGPVRRMEQVKKLEVAAMLPALLPYAQQQELAKLAPVRMEVPTGSQLRLQYSADGAAPVLAVRLQEMFGLLDTPAVDGGRRPVRLHLLSPGYKPVQVTQDLRSFWGNTYAEVRKELRRRYPKHHWPEDPWTAEAVRGVPRKGRPDA